MDEDTLKKIDELYELTKDNNRILHGIRRSARISAFFNVLKWLVIIVLSLLGYYYIQPYIDVTMKAYQSIEQNLKKIGDVGTKLPDLNTIFSGNSK